MRILLDECVPRRLKADIVGHEVSTVHDERWLGAKDAMLLRRAEGRFDVLVTVDQGLPQQHSIAQYSFAIVVLRARHTRYQELLPLVPRLLQALPSLSAGDVLTIED